MHFSTPHRARYRPPACLDARLRGLRYAKSCLVVRCTVTTGTMARDLRTPWRTQEATNRNQVRSIRTTHCGLHLNTRSDISACAVCLRSVAFNSRETYNKGTNNGRQGANLAPAMATLTHDVMNMHENMPTHDVHGPPT